MRKRLSIVFALVLVLCFGTIAFAQNDNGAPKMGGDKHSMGGHRSRRRHRRRHHRRHNSKHSSVKTGNGNTH